MTVITTHRSAIAWAAITSLGVSTLLMWLPALRTPLWGDDYVFLLAAHATNVSGAPWWSDFLPHSQLRFWRPLSQEAYWRLMEARFHGNALAMHAASLLFHVLASVGVGTLALCIARACRWLHARRIAILAGLLYSSLAMHLLPVHWAAAGNNSLLTVFTTLALSAWLVASCVGGLRRVVLLAVVPVLLAFALLTKESAVLIPLLMVVIGLFSGRVHWRRGDIAALVACALLVAGWLILDARFTTEPDPAYTLKLGSNVIRNGVSFVAWLSNVPREAMRMAVVGDKGKALMWITITAVPMLTAWGLALRRGHSLLSWRQWLFVALFAILAYGPYFLFSWNSYAYYAAISAVLPTIALAYLSTMTRQAWITVALVAASSWLAIAGTRQIPQPGLIARANWGEHLLRQLESQPARVPLWVETQDPQRFYAVGHAGLAWRLRIDPAAIHLTSACPAQPTHCLVIQNDGGWHWRSASGADPQASGTDAAIAPGQRPFP